MIVDEIEIMISEGAVINYTAVADRLGITRSILYYPEIKAYLKDRYPEYFEKKYPDNDTVISEQKERLLKCQKARDEARAANTTLRKELADLKGKYADLKRKHMKLLGAYQELESKSYQTY